MALQRLHHRPRRRQVPLSILFVAVFEWGPMGVLLANLVTAAGMQLALLPTYVRKVDWRGTAI